MRTLAVLSTVLLLGVPSQASADVMAITPDLVARISALAKAARDKSPTDPRAAADAFSIAFNGTFGDVAPISLEVSTHKDLGIQFLTPIVATASAFRAALMNLEPLPTEAATQDVVLYVTPKTMLAPSITRIVVFRGDQQIPALTSALAPKEYQNRLGAKTEIIAGQLTYPTTLFDGSGPVKVLCYTAEGLFREWSITAAWAKEVK